MAKKLYIYRNEKLVTIKPGVTEESLRLDGYFNRHPDAIVCKGCKPSVEKAEQWMENGIAKAVDGCEVEPDGKCEHGAPSWLLVCGCI
jgi:hypothetical protein